MSHTRDKKLITKEVEDRVCIMYQNNMLLHDIAEALNIERHTVVRALKRRGLYCVNRSKVHLDHDRIIRNQQILLFTQQGFTIRQIAQKMHISKSSVQYIVSKFYHDLIPQRERQVPNYKYLFDEHFFTSIDTEEKAYWLGFLYVDGCITERSVRCELALKDRLHLEKFRDAIKYFGANFYFRKDIESIALIIGSTTMASDLISHGCFHNKSRLIRFPESDTVPLSLINHFMRGYFDGDGCISINDKTRSSFSVVSNFTFLQSYQDMLNFGIHKNTKVKIQSTKSKDIGIFMLGGNRQVKKIYDFLYKDATVYLERKKEKFDIIISRLNAKSTKKR